jgi:hypothetical protein
MTTTKCTFEDCDKPIDAHGQNLICAFCKRPAQDHFAIHARPMWGPEVPLCDECGKGQFPTCPEIWNKIGEDIDARRFDPDFLNGSGAWSQARADAAAIALKDDDS